MLEGVLFDMDGVLMDSEKFIAKAAVEMFREKGLEVSLSDFVPFTGTGEDRYLGGVAEKYNFPLDVTDAKIRVYEIYDQIVAGQLTLFPGVCHFIERCREKGLKMAVATSADKIKLMINLRETGLSEDLFDTLVTAEEVEHKKPAPDLYLKAAEKLNLPPSHCLVIEDAPSGIQAGKQAGARTLGLLTGFSSEALKEADWMAEDLAHVPNEIWQTDEQNK